MPASPSAPASPSPPAGLRVLETGSGWLAADVADRRTWTLWLTADDRRELRAALDRVRPLVAAADGDLSVVDRFSFHLESLATTLAALRPVLLDGRGFVLIRGLDLDGWSDEELTLAFWGIGLHLGDPRAQNKHGHVLGDVTDQGRTKREVEARGNEIGGIALEYHSDGADIVGLLCLRSARDGGLSQLASSVAIHNDLVVRRPDLAVALYGDLPYDWKGEETAGAAPWFTKPTFTCFHDRLFVRFIPEYIWASQRHPGAPRLDPISREAIDEVLALAHDPRFELTMDLRPGDMQFVYNYHLLHGRSAYTDEPGAGRRRHLKRLWLSSVDPLDLPPRFRRRGQGHWEARRSLSGVAPVDRPPSTAHDR